MLAIFGLTTLIVYLQSLISVLPGIYPGLIESKVRVAFYFAVNSLISKLKLKKNIKLVSKHTKSIISVNKIGPDWKERCDEGLDG